MIFVWTIFVQISMWILQYSVIIEDNCISSLYAVWYRYIITDRTTKTFCLFFEVRDRSFFSMENHYKGWDKECTLYMHHDIQYEHITRAKGWECYCGYRLWILSNMVLDFVHLTFQILPQIKKLVEKNKLQFTTFIVLLKILKIMIETIKWFWFILKCHSY